MALRKSIGKSIKKYVFWNVAFCWEGLPLQSERCFQDFSGDGKLTKMHANSIQKTLQIIKKPRPKPLQNHACKKCNKKCQKVRSRPPKWWIWGTPLVTQNSSWGFLWASVFQSLSPYTSKGSKLFQITNNMWQNHRKWSQKWSPRLENWVKTEVTSDSKKGWLCVLLPWV